MNDFIFIVFIVFICVILVLYSLAASAKTVSKVGRRTIASDGHAIPRSNDITCQGQYRHKHTDSSEPRFIVHEDPEEGYVVLNGIIRRIEDCKNL